MSTSPQPGARTYPFDARPLVDPVDQNAVRAHKKAMQDAGRVPASFSGASVVVGIVVAVVVIVGVTIISTVVGLVGSAISASVGNSLGGVVGGLFAFVPLAFIALIAGGIVFAIVRGGRGTAERMYRLDHFAAANAMSYVPRFDDPGLPGMIFGQGSARHSSDLVRGDHPRFVEFANYRYTTGSGKDSTTHRWGYVAVKLDVPLPHIVLDAIGNNALFGSNLPASFDKDQRLSLEGDFDRHFALYCPEGYERDALYLFTPDIMARFIDTAAALDVEIVDDWLFLYARRDFSTLDPATWAWLFSVVGALLDKLARWSRWRDDRLTDAAVSAPAWSDDAGATGGAASALPFAAPIQTLQPPPAGVAHPGRRLARRTPWVGIGIVALVALVWLVMQAGGFAALLGGMVGGVP